jgi:hypothetical protein
VVKTDVELIDTSGRRLRCDAFVDAPIPADPGLRLPVVGSYALSGQQRSDYLSGSSGLLMRRRLVEDVADAERFELRGDLPADNRILEHEIGSPEDEVPSLGFQWHPDGLKILVSGGDPPRIAGRRSTKGYDLSGVEEAARAIRLRAWTNLIQRPDGIYRAAPVPSIRVTQTGYGGWDVSHQIVDAPVDREMVFSITRVEEANAWIRILRHSDLGRGVGGVETYEPDLLPSGPSDLELIVAARAPAVAGVRALDPIGLPSDLIHSWHDAANAPEIVDGEGVAGAVRVGSSVARLVTYLGSAAPDYSGLVDLQRLCRRVGMEIGLLPRLLPEGPAP